MEEVEEIDLKELFKIFWQKKFVIILITILFMFLGGIYSQTLVVPKYKSTTKLLLAVDSSATSKNAETITTTEVAINSNLVSTYSELVKSNKIIRTVISNLGINESEVAVRNSVSVTAVDDTEIIEITVQNQDAVIAAKIANEMAKVFIDTIKEYYGIENVHIVDEAEVAEIPFNINHMKDIVIFAFIGIIFSAIYIFISYILDTSIKSVEDIERLGVTVLATIPIYEVDTETNKKRAYKRKGGK